MDQVIAKVLLSIAIIFAGGVVTYKSIKSNSKQKNHFNPSVSTHEDLMNPFRWVVSYILDYTPGWLVGGAFMAIGFWLLYLTFKG